MNIIEELRYHETNQLDEWYDTKEKEQKRFLKGIVKYGEQHPDELKHYCSSTIPDEFSSLSLVYEALSEYSVSWNQFLFDEIQRVVLLAKNGRIDPEYLEVLEDIETEDIYSKTEEIYVQIIDFLVGNLSLTGNGKFNFQLLELLDWYLTDYDEDDDVHDGEVWVARIKEFAIEGSPEIKEKAREVLDNFDLDFSFSPLTFKERISRFFK
ncbi:hypothetical protein POV27_06660 [Aureisphaera galaxeae]|uniref:hypothetical protein n=1 Tax=Aureisphaera galaxeae TaxID=1538023 RepID=UPI00234FD0A2|nr:hypothetical protein [Aureisphaera galaxeae]MDC8003725.1 hypothetical protein [Aureisphaera galaxeae]